MAHFNVLTVIELGLRAPFIGYIISLSLYGTTVAQSIHYCYYFKGDSMAIKNLVLTLCITETFHVYLLSHMLWNMLVQGRLRGVAALLDFSWQQLASFGVAFFVTFMVQCFFCMRVWRVCKNAILTCIIVSGFVILFYAGRQMYEERHKPKGITTVIQLGSGMAFMANSIRHKNATNIYDVIGTRTARIQLVSSMICDLTISGALVYYFYSFRIGTKRTNAILQQLIMLSVNMGLLLCLVTAITLILFEVATGSSLPLGPHFIISRLYANSLLATLNSRKHIREISQRTVSFTLPTLDVSSSNRT